MITIIINSFYTLVLSPVDVYTADSSMHKTTENNTAQQSRAEASNAKSVE